MTTLGRILVLPFLMVMLIPAGVFPTRAAGGRIPIYEVPTTIDAPGSYYLTRDLSGSPAQALITVAAVNVTIDLAGHTLEHQGNAHSVIGSSGAPTNVEIFGGRIVGGLHGVHLFNVAGPSFDVRLHDLMINGASDAGIFVEGGFEVAIPSQAVIEHVQMADVGGNGIVLYAVDAGRVTHNTVRDAGGSGIHVDNSYGVFVGHNTSSGNSGNGILIETSTSVVVEENQLTRNDAFALVFRTIPGTNFTDCYLHNRMFNNAFGDLDLQNTSSYAVEPCEP